VARPWAMTLAIEPQYRSTRDTTSPVQAWII
jgi:hypothetical protein